MSNIPEVSIPDVPIESVILDVREDDEWAAGHVDGASHIPSAEVPLRLSEVPEGDPIYVICRSGGRSGRVTGWLNDNGFNAINVDGGMQAWQQAGRYMVADGGGTPDVI